MALILAVATAVTWHELANDQFGFTALLLTSSLIGINSRRWSDVLRVTPHDFYHLPAYVALSAKQLGGDPAALVVEGRDGATMLLPLITRPIEGGGCDATSPYGYPGPIVAGTAEPAFVSDAMNEGVRLLADEGFVSLFVRYHPIFNPVPGTGIGTLVLHGHTIVIDLAQDDASMWQETRRNHRRDIRKALLAGHRVYEDHDLVHFWRFVELYRQTMRRAGAAPFYVFDDAYFLALKDALGPRLHLIVAEIEGEVAAASIEVETSGIVQDHLTGTDERYSHLALGKYLIHFIRSWARERGNRWMHLGGGLGAGSDSLLAFKTGFSDRRAPFHTQRVVLDDQHYRNLVQTHNPAADPGALEDFFPAYRQL